MHRRPEVPSHPAARFAQPRHDPDAVATHGVNRLRREAEVRNDRNARSRQRLHLRQDTRAAPSLTACAPASFMNRAAVSNAWAGRLWYDRMAGRRSPSRVTIHAQPPARAGSVRLDGDGSVESYP